MITPHKKIDFNLNQNWFKSFQCITLWVTFVTILCLIQTTLCCVLAWMQVKCYSTTQTHVFISTVSSAGWWCWIIWWSLQFRLLSLSAGRWMWCLLTGCDLLLIWPYYILVASVELCAHKELPPLPFPSCSSNLTPLEVGCQSNVPWPFSLKFSYFPAHIFFMAATYVVAVKPPVLVLFIF